jgi:endonuclease G, mitochondrial
MGRGTGIDWTIFNFGSYAVKKLRFFIIATFLCSLLSLPAFGAPAQCPQFYPNGKAPVFLNKKLGANTQQICYEGYALIHSGVTRTALTSVEHLTQASLTAPHPHRVDAFHSDPNVPKADRAELNDYSRSGYDRGHMAPSGDMATEHSQQESFSLANMVPQDHDDNTKLWEGIEAATRSLAEREGELYVVTGPIFYGSELKRLNERVLVPTYIYKAVYDPSRKEAAAYLVRNEPGMHYAVISISKLEQLSGIDPTPGLSESVKEKAMALPVPRAHSMHPGVEDPSIVPAK